MKALWFLAGVLLGTLVLLPGLFWGVPWCKFLVGADRVLAGEMPYRDFWTMYAPGSFYLNAGLFTLFGRELWVQGLTSLGLTATAAMLFQRLHRAAGTPGVLTCALTLVFLLGSWKTAPELTSYPPALCAVLASLFALERSYHGHVTRRLFAAGLFIGLAAVFKHDVGFYALVTVLIANAVARRAHVPGGRDSAWRELFALGAGVLVFFGPVFVWLAWTAPAQAWQHLVVFPATVFPGVFGQPYPGWWFDLGGFTSWLEQPGDLSRARDAFGGLSSWLRCFLPELALVVTLLVYLRHRRGLAPLDRVRVVQWWVWMVPFWSAAHVQQNTHLFSMAIGASFLAARAWRARVFARSSGKQRALRAALAALGLVYAGALMIPAAMDAYMAAAYWPKGQLLGLPGTKGIRVSSGDALFWRPLTEFVQRGVGPDEPIYVGVERHDAIVISNQRPYFLCQRPIPVPYNELHPGVADSHVGQASLIEDLQASELRCVILWQFGWSRDTLDRIRAARVAFDENLGAVDLDRWLHANFELVREMGEMNVYWRKGAERPFE